ncbi:MAG: aminotransferase class IV [Deltaproteobacteria bacterium]|nr:aminotransferase class IV [Deltaproteobacteria bacterium]
MDLKLINKEEFVKTLLAQRQTWHDTYLAMYSSIWKGYVVEPACMLVPADDHLVHRGDGVFDVMRCVCGKIYQLEAHLSRLERSARAVHIDFPKEFEGIRELIKTLVVKGGQEECLIRVVLSRGPGSFTANPFDCPSSQLYVNIVRYHEPPKSYYEKGVSLITSKIPVKNSFFATVKSCNYLPNALMKRDALASGCDYAVALDENGFLAECSTENIGVLSMDGHLKFPGFERTLAGITVQRVAEIALNLVKNGIIQDVSFSPITPEQAYQASELFIMGTSVNIVPVKKYDGKKIGKGIPGPVFLRLSELMKKDMRENSTLLTELEWEKK